MLFGFISSVTLASSRAKGSLAVVANSLLAFWKTKSNPYIWSAHQYFLVQFQSPIANNDPEKVFPVFFIF